MYPRSLRRALAACVARPWLSLACAAAVGVMAAVVYGFSTEPVLVPRIAVNAAQPPYKTYADARVAIAEGQARAAASGKMLMVTFGANWCPDCLMLHANLRNPDTRAYAQEHFEIVQIDVGDAQKSAAVQRDLGIVVNVIPLSVFYSADGRLVGDTLAGELKPSRHYSSRDIRDFLREVVDYHRIVSPDQRQ